MPSTPEQLNRPSKNVDSNLSKLAMAYLINHRNNLSTFLRWFLPLRMQILTGCSILYLYGDTLNNLFLPVQENSRSEDACKRIYFHLFTMSDCRSLLAGWLIGWFACHYDNRRDVVNLRPIIVSSVVTVHYFARPSLAQPS